MSTGRARVAVALAPGALVLTLTAGLALWWAGVVGSAPPASPAPPSPQAAAAVPTALSRAAGPVVPGGPDPAWVGRVAAATGIPARALTAYAGAQLSLDAEDPDCGLTWTMLAGHGWVESHHGTLGGSSLGSDGRPTDGPLVGVALDGAGPVAALPDTDEGRLDADPVWDRAVGPMQFIPATWARWASDGDGDGVLDPQDVDDAALSAARYLCAGARHLGDGQAWRSAVLSYNPSTGYLVAVQSTANAYARRSLS